MRPIAAAVLILLGTCAASPATITDLYDGSAGGTPSAQGWLYSTSPNPSATQGAAGGITTLDTTIQQADQAGYVRTPMLSSPVLDRAAGYTIVFDAGIVSESHQADDRDGDGVDDRAGFSVIAIGNDRLGIELAFWEDEVWAYEYEDVGGSFDFTHSEGAAFDTTSSMRRYYLGVQGTDYQLFVGDVLLMSGGLRDYSGRGEPYNVPSLLFLGDDTTKAGAEVQLAYVAHVDSLVPEPATLSLLVVLALSLPKRGGRPRFRTR